MSNRARAKKSERTGIQQRMSAVALDDSTATAESAGLKFVSDDSPGIGREKRGKLFRYTGSDGRVIRDQRTLNRIRSLAIPPAWTDVWICPDPNGHVQATGRDARGRKQYRYHADWQRVRDEAKFDRLMAFGRLLPKLRRTIRRDMSRSGIGRRKVLATVTYLLEATLIRVGNREYVRANKSFGLTTLQDRHVEVRGTRIFFGSRVRQARNGASSTRTLASPASSVHARICLGNTCSNTRTTTGQRTRSHRRTSTATCEKSATCQFRQRTSGPGQALFSRQWHCRSSIKSTQPRQQRPTFAPLLQPSPRDSAIRQRSAASATSIPKCSPATWRAPCAKP